MQVIADSRDEVGILVQAFNEMITQIQWRDTALQQAHDELEQRGDRAHSPARSG